MVLASVMPSEIKLKNLVVPLFASKRPNAKILTSLSSESLLLGDLIALILLPRTAPQGVFYSFGVVLRSGVKLLKRGFFASQLDSLPSTMGITGSSPTFMVHALNQKDQTLSVGLKAAR
jgi:hypothetical protein